MQPRNVQCDRRTCNSEVKAKTEEEATVICTLRGTGVRKAAREQSSGVNWGTSRFPPQADFPWGGRPRRESISGGEGFRGSDEAIVSDDPSGQQNPLASQGPLDGRVWSCWGRATLNREVLRTGNSHRDRGFPGTATAVAYITPAAKKVIYQPEARARMRCVSLAARRVNMQQHAELPCRGNRVRRKVAPGS